MSGARAFEDFAEQLNQLDVPDTITARELLEHIGRIAKEVAKSEADADYAEYMGDDM